MSIVPVHSALLDTGMDVTVKSLPDCKRGREEYAVAPLCTTVKDHNNKFLQRKVDLLFEFCLSKLQLQVLEEPVGSFEDMDLFNLRVILGKSFLWTCQCRETLPSLSHFIRILVIKYGTGKHIYFKSNKRNLFKEKWKIFEETILTNNLSWTTLLLRKIVKLKKYVNKN